MPSFRNLDAYPKSRTLLNHVLTTAQSAHRRCALERAYAGAPFVYFDELERELVHTIAASGQDLGACLQDMDAFNSLTADTENDAWYVQPRAFSSMHLDALLLGFAQRRLALTCDQVLSHARAAKRVLEVGCGSGRLSAMLADAAAEWQFTLLDRSPAAVDFATALHAVRGAGGRVECKVGDLADIPAPDESFDLVIAAEVLEHAPHPQASTKELLRVLRLGGWLAVSVPIDLEIAMHPVVFGSAQEIVAFFDAFPLVRVTAEVVRPDATTDAIADVFPHFAGCVNAVFRKT